MINLNLDNLNLQKEKYLIVGCSSGPDSMALLHYLKNNTQNIIICAHINHNVRKESTKEQEYLKKYCNQNNIIFETTKITEYTENNFENEARKKRFDFFKKIVNKYHAKYLFLAHHGDDLIETIIMKINRGSNIEGYAGIKSITPKDNYYIIRPLLPYTKQDLINYNKKYDITYFIDQTNYDTKYTRNRIRNQILPSLKKENPQIHLQFLKFSNTLQEYNNYINYETTQILKKIYINNQLNLTKFKKLDKLIQKNILYQILNTYYQNQPNIIKEKNINSILNIINNKKPNLSINLPNNIICIKEYEKLSLKNDIKDNDYKLKLKKINTINNITITKINDSQTDGNDICRLNSQKLKLPLYLRNRNSGDYIELMGLNKRKKIKDIFIDEKIPKSKRNSYPLLVDADNNILWIPNIKKSKFNAKKGQLCDIILKYCEKEENNE